jgi:GNAT superfamily N-acetyltransferase
MENNLLIPFPTVIQCAGYTPAALEATASLLFTEPSPFNPNDGPTSTGSHQPRLWDVEQWNEARDMSNVLDLWTQNISSRFAIDQATLASLLRRPGYAKHYVVRDLRAGEILDFCATYLSYVDQEGERLIASLAILIVRPTNRQQGVGLSLHNHAISQLKKTRGVVRLQLGSTFPRILLGPPTGSNTNEEWFQRRGWQLNKGVPGQGLGLRDVVLDLQKWGYVEPSCSSLLQFRSCVKEDRIKVLAIVEHVCIRQCKMGWFDQYSALINGPNVKDIVLGVEKGMVVAVALTYTPSCGSPIASNLPWAGQIGNDVGGVTCVCICRKSIFCFANSSTASNHYDFPI